MTGHDLKAYINQFHPEKNAFEWDHVGLQIGSLNQKITKLMITLDVTLEVVNQAIKEGANTILSHHPLFFNPMQTINTDIVKGKLIKLLLDHKIMVYSAHTNYDVSPTGMNQVLAETLLLDDIKVLDEDDIRPMGRIGKLSVPMNLGDFIDYIKAQLNLNNVSLIGSRTKPIQTVAISGGSGSHHYMAAKKKKADVYLTGDITYHVALDMIDAKMFAIDIGHFAEHLFKQSLKEDLEAHGFISVVLSKEISPYLFN